jgi:hypothetical protein
MGIIELFLTFHKGHGLPERAMARLFDELSAVQWRSRPHPVMNSVAWNVWHMARAEDIAVNRLITNSIQVFDTGEWGKQTNSGTRHHGSGRSDAEVTTLSQQIDLVALRAYYTAVRARTVAVVKTLTPAQLAEPLDEADPDNCDGLAYPGWTRGEMLIHLAMTYNYGHLYEICSICSLMDVQFWR